MSNNDSAHDTDLLNMAAPTPLVHDLGGPSSEYNYTIHNG